MGSATRGATESARAALARTSGVDLTTGEQLLGAARTIGSSKQLVSALTDPSATDSAKAGLIGTIFAGLQPAARTLLEGMVASRWSSGDDLLAGIEEVGIRAIAASAPAGSSVEGELFAFGQGVTSDAELELAIGSKRGAPEGKRDLVDALLAQASPQARSIAGHLVQQPRGRRIGELVRSAATTVADASGKGVATVTVARPLTDEQRSAIAQSIARRYGREHTLNQVIDPAVIGGVRVQVGDEVVDGSIAARLSELKLRLAG
ncbi:F0F1 ATP synthase subunit delta [Microcella daejeonensis]|uniref:ATP synthase subunit delta n=1 Tax=Microcella daejeonensis TaxID=2994971 RepID=A0A9E8MJZ0_9MICO|nr:F0F1 ATP synthase subunit delta [Microcella daejeonensis]WAB80949.1 F0F1 ATP synthase subunit delta [Microcella daejeonensis]